MCRRLLIGVWILATSVFTPMNLVYDLYCDEEGRMRKANNYLALGGKDKRIVND